MQQQSLKRQKQQLDLGEDVVYCAFMPTPLLGGCHLRNHVDSDLRAHLVMHHHHHLTRSTTQRMPFLQPIVLTSVNE